MPPLRIEMVVLRRLYVLHEGIGCIATDRGSTDSDSFPSFSSHHEKNIGFDNSGVAGNCQR